MGTRDTCLIVDRTLPSLVLLTRRPRICCAELCCGWQRPRLQLLDASVVTVTAKNVPRRRLGGAVPWGPLLWTDGSGAAP